MQKPLKQKPLRTFPVSRRQAAAGGVVLAAVIGAIFALDRNEPHQNRGLAPGLVYTAHGYGGFVLAPKAASHVRPAQAAVHPAIQRVRDAYNAGRYAAAEALADNVIASAVGSRNLARREGAAEARSLLAYSAARRHNLPLARVRFALARQDAASLPDKGKPAIPLGEVLPTLEEDAAYQHAVCTAALGDKPGAEQEYLAFMRTYPESTLVAGMIKRIGMLHGGDVPAADEAAWRQAEATAQSRQQAREREASLCGPECLAELLRRRGERADVHALAEAMHTSDRGTALDALAAEARRHGYSAQGLALTQKRLREQTLPLIALVAPGHYVLVDGVSASSVTLWDPDARGIGQGAARAIPAAQWRQQWRGVTLALVRG